MERPADSLQWVAEKQMLRLTRVKRSTWHNWIKEGLVDPVRPHAFDEAEVLEVVLVGALRRVHGLRDAAGIWRALHQRSDRQRLVAKAQTLVAEERFDLVLEPDGTGVRLAQDDEELAAAVRFTSDPRSVIVLVLADELRRVRDDFRVLAETGPIPRRDDGESGRRSNVTPFG
jgi:hypothetical protein